MKRVVKQTLLRVGVLAAAIATSRRSPEATAAAAATPVTPDWRTSPRRRPPRRQLDHVEEARDLTRLLTAGRATQAADRPANRIADAVARV